MKRNWEEKITHTLDQIEPSQQQTHQMWTAILQSKTKKEPKKFPVFRFTAVGMCILVLSVGTGIGVNAATDGALFSSLRSFVSQPEQQKKVASEGLKKSSFTEVYAPPLVGCSDAYIIFANERGLMIYGRNQEKLLAALDLQALDCNYFNADTVMTHIMMEDDMLYMYNEYKDETKTSQVYRYDLTKAGQENALSMVDDATEIETIQKKWNKFAANRKDTFDSIPLAQGEWNGSEKLKYSEESLVWTDQNGDKQLSCMLTLADGTSRIAYHCTVPPRGGKQQTAAQAAAALAQAAKVLPKPADGPLLVALDGRCAAGKTTIAAQMARQYGWGVVHLDDFFLQPIQRTPQRMAEPGGNLDRERLIAEVLEPLRAGQQGSYRLFDCRTMALTPGTVPLPQTPIILLEGSYSCHPDLWNYCALHAFVDVEPAEQLRRLAARAPEKLEDFKTRWIPKEETYFAHFQIPERCEVKV